MSIILGFLSLILLLWLLERFINARPQAVARRLRWIFGLGLGAIAVGLVVTGRLGVAIPLAVIAFNTLRNLIPLRTTMDGGPAAEGKATVRAAMLVIWLDPDTGDTDGNVLRGTFKGRTLSSLSIEESLALHAACAWDPESLVLVEVYLDRRDPSWRENPQAHDTAGNRAPRQGSAMTTQEAYEILGLQPGASHDEIRRAHRTLLKRLHPDRGGSDWLAARINTAKDKILG